MKTPATDPLTRAERTDFRETSLHSDVLEFIRRLSAKTGLMRVESMGRSGLGQEMPVLVFGATSPQDARAKKKPIIMVTANIHAGEVEGKEVLLMLARDMTLGTLQSWLDKLCLVFIPDYNPDGNDKISKENRKLDLARLEGQIGPDGGCGTRYTGEGINLNRDYMKMHAVESRNLSKLFQHWWPHLHVDCHTTDGSIHGYALTFDSALTRSGPMEPIDYMRRTMLPTVSRSLDKRTGLKTWFYGNFKDETDPTKGWATYSPLPRYGSHYRGLTGRFDILLEAYSYITFKERVVVTYEILRDIFDYTAAHGAEMTKIAEASEKARPEKIGVNYGVEKRGKNGELLFDYPAQLSEENVDLLTWDLESFRTRKIPGKKLQTYRGPYFGRFAPTKVVDRPSAYVFSGSLTSIADKLRDHGVRVEKTTAALQVEAESYVVEKLETTSSPDVGDHVFREPVARVKSQSGTVQVNKGDYVIRTDQRMGTVAVYLLEPESDDGLVRWGFFEGALKEGKPYPVYRVGPGARFSLQEDR